ncbi:hypothetical protein EV356DRAFT_505607 [Viridothelium virens]|uniref:GST N-terminal domain-containing protein n=1 Tax=Viridothelium virens TaxID=1048519 RepID=A0A6A6H2J1_VIRVR|nr:hypothetical protein EV356DRAFT_505607 [Viridothelium virens]
MSKLAIHNRGTADGWHGQIGLDSPFPPESGRYHMYIGLFCPLAHRANLVRHLKGLADAIDISVLKPYTKGQNRGWPGWEFPQTDDEYPQSTVDKVFDSDYLHEVYFKDDPHYQGRYTVPALWDKNSKSMVNTESAELLRNLQTGFNDILDSSHASLTLYPKHLQSKIDEIAEWMQRDLNAGVYKAGFAESQEVYDKNVIPVFGALNKIEKIISEHGGPYVLGREMTELDIRLYATAIRFDVVYVQHFKCNLGMIRHDYPVIHNWLKNLYWNHESFRETTNFKHIKENYTKSHPQVNPKAITPRGPYPDIEQGIESDFKKLNPGGVQLPEVLAWESQLS